jgi:hypothetical protein
VRERDQREALGVSRASGTVFIGMFVPDSDRFGGLIEHERWVSEALEIFAALFGGATALPPALGAWRDQEVGTENEDLIVERTVIVFSLAQQERITRQNLSMLGEFARRFGKATNQGEVGIYIKGRYLAITDFAT